ncbi:MAG: hypothetical protein SGILL_009281 [Bacillariaceae sp.]
MMAVVYARTSSDVEDAVRCAVFGGWQVSALNGRHSTWGMVDGYVVVEVSNITAPAVVDTDAQTITFGSGYTHGVLVNALRDMTPPNAMMSIGNGASVGYFGYLVGGGIGYATPAVGMGCDGLVEIQTVLFNGTTVVANEKQNQDILWASCGGGGGLGIVTEVTMRYTLAEVEDFSYGSLQFKVQDNLEDQAAMITDVLEFFGSPENTVYGGQILFGPDAFTFIGLFQGSIEQVEALMDSLSFSEYVETYDLQSSSIFAIASAYHVCNWMSGAMRGLVNRDSITNDTLQALESDIQNDLINGGITDINLSIEDFTDTSRRTCFNETLLDAMVTVAGNRSSFLSWGLHIASNPRDEDFDAEWSTVRPAGKIRFMPVPSVDVMEKLLSVLAGFPDEGPISITRVSSGKVMSRGLQDTAFPWRQSPLMTRLRKNVLVPTMEVLQEAYPNQLGGYYGLSDPFDSNWQYTYYGSNYARLGEIRAKYDPLNTFGKKLTPTQIFSSPVIDDTASFEEEVDGDTEEDADANATGSSGTAVLGIPFSSFMVQTVVPTILIVHLFGVAL